MSFMDQDYHIHTHYSNCGREENTAEAILGKMSTLGFRVAGFSDHLHPITHSSIFPRLRADVARIETDLTVLFGTEACVLNPDEIVIPEDWVERFDYVILAPTHYHLEWVASPFFDTPRRAAEFVLAMHRRAVSTPFADIIAHPFANTKRLGDERAVLEAIRDDEIEEVVDRAYENGIAFEFRLENRQDGPLADLLIRLYARCKRSGVKVSPGSDAHQLERVGRTQTLGEALRRAGLDAGDFVDLSARAERGRWP